MAKSIVSVLHTNPETVFRDISKIMDLILERIPLINHTAAIIMCRGVKGE